MNWALAGLNGAHGTRWGRHKKTCLLNWPVRVTGPGLLDGFGYKKTPPEPSSLPFLYEMYLGIMEAGLVGRLNHGSRISRKIERKSKQQVPHALVELVPDSWLICLQANMLTKGWQIF